MTFVPGDASRVDLVAASSLFRPDDGGLSFCRMQARGLPTVAVDSGNAELLYLATATNGRGLFRSTDGGATERGLTHPGSN